MLGVGVLSLIAVLEVPVVLTYARESGRTLKVEGFSIDVLALVVAGFLTRLITRMPVLIAGIASAIPVYAIVLFVVITGWSEAASQQRVLVLTILTLLLSPLPGVFGALLRVS